MPVESRIRQIESDCIAKYGEFDWERLSEEAQDEYDSLCILLDELQDTEEPITLEEYKMQNILDRNEINIMLAFATCICGQ